MHIEGVGEVAAEVAQQAIGATIGDEIGRGLEEGLFQGHGRANFVALLIGFFQVGRHDRVAKTEGGAGKLLTQASIHARLVALVGLDGVGAQQVGQEFVIGDAGDLGRHNGAGLVVELVAAPIGMGQFECVDLAVVFA